MDMIFEFLLNWWGLIGVTVFLAVGYFFFREKMLEMVKAFIFYAEEKSRRGLLKSGKEKKQWVVDNGYQYVPPVIKPFISKEAFAVIVQFVFDRMVKWAEDNQLR